MEINFRKLKLVTTSSYADIYVHDGETDQTEGLVMTPNHMLRQEHPTEHDKEYILVFHEDGKLDALFHRLHPENLPKQENGDVVMWDVMFIEPSRLVREPRPAEPIMSEEKSNDDAEPEPGPGDPQIIVRNIKQDPNHFGSEAGKALRDGKELAFIRRVLKKWKEVYQDYGELSDFLAGYFNLTESISWYELQLYGYTIMQINKVGEKLESDNYLFLRCDIPFVDWAYKWYDAALYDYWILHKELTEDDIRRLAYRNGDNYEELKKLEAQGGYGEGKMWRSIKDQVTEIASHNVNYTFWSD